MAQKAQAVESCRLKIGMLAFTEKEQEADWIVSRRSSDPDAIVDEYMWHMKRAKDKLPPMSGKRMKIDRTEAKRMILRGYVEFLLGGEDGRTELLTKRGTWFVVPPEKRKGAHINDLFDAADLVDPCGVNIGRGYE
ncbi:hypothetical protein [Roseateles microcysteis]|uniref:hypothetical protein n=1 Tax=Roseateles microcysteis TaxID=3119057 RepID=UPI002FE648C3